MTSAVTTVRMAGVKPRGKLLAALSISQTAIHVNPRKQVLGALVDVP